jgi:hypothetical protein
VVLGENASPVGAESPIHLVQPAIRLKSSAISKIYPIGRASNPVLWWKFLEFSGAKIIKLGYYESS